MALARKIALLIGLLAAAGGLLGCGGSEERTNAKIDPTTAGEFTAKLDVIKGYVDGGDCGNASDAVDGLSTAADERSQDTGRQFTADFKELLADLRTQIEADCVPQDDVTKPTTETTSTEETIETTTSTTQPETTTTDKPEEPDDPPPATTPDPDIPEDPDGDISPSGGIAPGAKR